MSGTFDFKEPVFLGAGDVSKQHCRDVHERLDRGLDLLSALQQPDRSSSNEAALRAAEERKKDTAELDQIARDLVMALTGKTVYFPDEPVEPVQHLNLERVRMDRSDPRNFTHWLVIRAISAHAPRDPALKAVWDKLKIDDVPIEFKIAGVNAPFERVLHGIEEQLDRMIEEKAKELLKERCGGLQDAIHDLEQELRSRTRELFPLARDED